jgi:hypothetical protein
MNRGKTREMRELIRASRKAKVKGHRSTRTVECPYCSQVFKRTIINHLKIKHPTKWKRWQKDMLELYNQGYSSMEIVRECYILFSWSLIEREVMKLAEEKKFL